MKAVSATRNTLNWSMKNCSRNATCGPASTTRTVSATAAAKVQKLISEFSSAAQQRAPNAASSRPPSSGESSSAMSCRSIILEFFHVGDVEAVEGLADLEEEDAEDEGGHQHVERDAQLHHQRHAVRGAGCGEEQAVFHRQEADHLRNRLAPGEHHQQRQQHAGQRDTDQAEGDAFGELRDRSEER